MTFAADAAGTLELDQSEDFTGTVVGFDANDTFAFTDLAFSDQVSMDYVENADGTGGTLIVKDGIQTTDILLDGDYDLSGFLAEADDLGGVEVTYTPVQAGQVTVVDLLI